MIRGNVVGMNSHRADWSQEDSTKPDFIKNKPDVATEAYVDSKHLSGTVSLPASGWADLAQTVAVPGILATDNPHYTVVYGSSREAEKEAFALVDQLETTAGAFVFTCFSEAPTIDLTIGWEVNR